MKIQMTATVRGSSDGFTVQRFEAGKTYDTTQNIVHSLACTLIHRKQAVQVNAPTVEEGMEQFMAELAAERANRLNADRL